MIPWPPEILEAFARWARGDIIPPSGGGGAGAPWW